MNKQGVPNNNELSVLRCIGTGWRSVEWCYKKAGIDVFESTYQVLALMYRQGWLERRYVKSKTGRNEAHYKRTAKGTRVLNAMRMLEAEMKKKK